MVKIRDEKKFFLMLSILSKGILNSSRNSTCNFSYYFFIHSLDVKRFFSFLVQTSFIMIMCCCVDMYLRPLALGEMLASPLNLWLYLFYKFGFDHDFERHRRFPYSSSFSAFLQVIVGMTNKKWQKTFDRKENNIKLMLTALTEESVFRVAVHLKESKRQRLMFTHFISTLLHVHFLVFSYFSHHIPVQFSHTQTFITFLTFASLFRAR